MAGSVNKVIIIGHLGSDPEMRYTPGGAAVCNFRMATNESWTDRDGQRQERTEWHRVVVWGKQAEHCGKFLKKGRQAYLEGRLQTRQWDDRDGNKRYTTEIVATQVTFLGGRDEGGGGGGYGGGNDGGYGGGGGGGGGYGGGGGMTSNDNMGFAGGGGGGAPPMPNQPPAGMGGGGGGGGGFQGPPSDDDVPF